MQAVSINSSNDFLLQIPQTSESNTKIEEPKKSFSELISKAKAAEEEKEPSSGDAVEQKAEDCADIQQKDFEEKVVAQEQKESIPKNHADSEISRKKNSKKIASNERKQNKLDAKAESQNNELSEKMPIHSAILLEQQNIQNKSQLEDSQNSNSVGVLLKNVEKNAGRNEELSVSEVSIEQSGIETDFLQTLPHKENLSEIDNKNIKSNNSKNEKTKVSKAENQSKITVSDYRTEAAEKKPVVEEKSLKTVEVHESEVVMELNSNAQQNILSLDSQSASANGSDFQAMLSNQIQHNAGDIVKAGQIILKDKNEGSIKLILHPESLGNVKIDLQISDKNITGRIVVASQEAFNAFRDSTDSLKQAFLNSGFDSAGLELAFAGQNAESGQFSEKREDPSALFVANREYGIFSDSGNEEYESEALSLYTKNSVNIVA